MSANQCKKLLVEYLDYLKNPKDKPKRSDQLILVLDEDKPEELWRDDYIALIMTKLAVGTVEFNILDKKVVKELERLARQGASRPRQMGPVDFQFVRRT